MINSHDASKKIVISHSPQFQKEIVSIILNNPLFASRYYAHVYKNPDLKSHKKVISVGYLEKILEAFYALYEKNNFSSPTIGLVENYIQNSLMEFDEIQEINDNLRKVSVVRIESVRLHEEELIKLAIVVKNINFYVKTSNSFKNGNVNEIYNFNKALKEHLEECAKIQFSKNNLVDTTNFFQIINDYARDCYTNIPTGIAELDEDLGGGGEYGGIGRQEVTIVLSGVNDGKSLTTVAIECNALRKGYKTRHINYEGKKLQPPMRFISNLSGVHYKRLVHFRDEVQKSSSAELEKYLTKDEVAAVLKAQEAFSKNFKIFHEITNCDIEALETQVTEGYAEEPFDLLVIDYAQHITAPSIAGAKHEKLAYVFRRLEVLASKLNIAVVTPMQVNRAGLNEMRNESKDGIKYPVYSMDNVSEVKAAVDTAATIITFNRTPQERINKCGRFAILKQREGNLGKQVGIMSDFSTMNVTKGDRYYVGYGEETESEKPRTFSAIERAVSEGSKGLVFGLESLPCEAPDAVMRTITSAMDDLDKRLKDLKRKETENKMVSEGRQPIPRDDISTEEYLIGLEDEIDELRDSVDKIIEMLDGNEIVKNYFRNIIALKKDEIAKYVTSVNIASVEKSADKDVVMATRTLKRLFTEDSGKVLLERLV